MMNNNIEALERRYQELYNDFQGGRIDESTFVSGVDDLQFQDDWGRYWMIGTQSGSWHYYDGQAWHQADPRDADKLPFMDEQGVYWQRGVKSGDWYYYQPDTGEWIKPSREDHTPAPTPRRDTMPASSPHLQGNASSYTGPAAPSQPHLYSATSGPQAPAQSDGELFQDDEGRYWSIGAKTGQWYFYDHDGWHPAHEFQPTVMGPAPQPQSYAPPPYQSQAYPAQVPYQPGYDPYQPAYYPPSQPYAPPAQPSPQAPPPAQAYAPPPVVDQSPAQPDASPVSGAAKTDSIPNPPTSRSKSGSWYYFDGDQWLKYSADEAPGDEPPPDEPKTAPAKEKEEKPAAKAAPKPKKKEAPKEEPVEEPVVAELFEEDDGPPPEVVDVEIVTVIEAEPDVDEEPEPVRPAREPARRTAAYAPSVAEDEIRPRRVNRSATRPVEPQRQPRARSASDPGRPVAPRKRESTQEPTIIVPTESTASNIGAGKSNRPASRPVRVSPGDQRRARENTMPMEPVAAASAAAAAKTVGTPVQRKEGATQPMTAPTRVDPAQARTARLDTKPVRTTAPVAAPPVAKPEPEKTGYTFGDVLRSFPSTIWTFVGGMAVLLIFALAIIGFQFLGGDESDSTGSLIAASEATPTLIGAVANETPTAVPTATGQPEAVDTPEPAVLTAFSSADLGLTLEYPENWEMEEAANLVIFSPSSDSLDPTDIKDSAFWVEKSDEEGVAISDLLAGILANFPADVETLNEGTISIASQTWTSVQIRFEDEDLAGQGIATLAVTTKDEVGYTLVAVSPASSWSVLRPTFQEMINSFRFGVEEVPSASTGGGAIASEADEDSGTPVAAGADEEDGTSGSATTTPSTPEVTPTPTVEATPVVHIVQAGDTLGAIAAQYGVDIDLLIEENGITDPGSLRLEQELIIPFTAEQLAAYNEGRDPAEVGRDRPAATAEADEGTPTAAEDETDEGATSTDDEADEADTASNGSAGSSSGQAAEVGGRIVYPAYNPSINSYDIWMYNIGTGEQTVIAGNASQPAFNRDGSLLAYRSWDRGNRGIFFRDFVGGRGGQVTGFVEDGLPTWSPDGYSFAFASRREGDRVPRIFRGNQAGDGDTGIGFVGEYVAAFPDGRLVVKGCSPSGDCGLYVMGPEGGNATKISGESSDTAPAVSPDGSRIAFMSAARGATNWEIWVMNADGSNAKRLTENGSNEGLPAWSPDGKSIAFVSDQGGLWALWVMNADGSNQRKLINMSGSPDGQVLQDTDNSKGWVEERISWAP